MITKEDAIRAIKKLCMFDGETPQMIWSTDAMDAVRGLPDQGGWISVKDRLPEVGQKVLTYSKFGHISDRILERHGGMNGYDVLLFSPDGMKPGTDILHWMPLPQTPEEGGEIDG